MLATTVVTVFMPYMIPGPMQSRTALTSLLARAIRSPVRCFWKNDRDSVWR